jgi:hypothetical protein
MQSETKAEQAVCLHCSETYVRAVVGLRTVAQLKKVPETERAEKLVELEGITREHAEAWLKRTTCISHVRSEKRTVRAAAANSPHGKQSGVGIADSTGIEWRLLA